MKIDKSDFVHRGIQVEVTVASKMIPHLAQYKLLRSKSQFW